MKLDSGTKFLLVVVALLAAMMTAAGFVTYHNIFDPKPVVQDVAIDSTTIEVETTIDDTTEVEIGSDSLSTGGNGKRQLRSSWVDFRVDTTQYSVAGSVYGCHIQKVRIYQVTTRSQITPRVEELAGGGYRVSATGGLGTRITRHEGKTDASNPASWEIGVPEKPKWYEFGWFRPELSVWSILSEDSGILGLDLGWQEKPLGVKLGWDEFRAKPKYIGLRYKIIGG